MALISNGCVTRSTTAAGQYPGLRQISSLRAYDVRFRIVQSTVKSTLWCAAYSNFCSAIGAGICDIAWVKQTVQMINFIHQAVDKYNETNAGK